MGQIVETEKPNFLKAVELILAKPEDIKKETLHKAIDVEHENEMADMEEDKNEE